MHYPTDRVTHTTAFVTPVVEHWLEREIAQWVHPMKDRSDDPSHHERTHLPRSYISLPRVYSVFVVNNILYTRQQILYSQSLDCQRQPSICITLNIHIQRIYSMYLFMVFIFYILFYCCCIVLFV